MTTNPNDIDVETYPAIAVIGMAGRFPEAQNLDEFWQNLVEGRDCIARFSDKELRESGIDEELITNPRYIKARGILSGIDLFDADFFDLTASDAMIMDPQQRLFLELCWEALELSGYSTLENRSVAVYAGMSDSTYLSNCLLHNDEILRTNSHYQLSLATSNHFLATKISYLLNLTGPSITINTACSTSLVAVIEACKSLLSYECDIALAGGIAIRVPQIRGYLHQEGGIYSSDGTCRAFDKLSSGIVSSNGGGVVVLKRLNEAVQAGDSIDAVIRSYAVNNDGATKIGYSAPSILEQARCVATALAPIGAESISYIEAHGTGTTLGDPVEIAALTKAFRHYTSKKNYCALGSVKTNIGHLDVAAGIAGLIKTILALKNKILPSSLYFNQSNPAINFAETPFYVNVKTSSWNNEFPCRAGISSFGIGGTNAHLIIEEAPLLPDQTVMQDNFIVPLSAKSENALKQQQKNLLYYLQKQKIDKTKLSNIAYTLQVGRQTYEYRKVFICKDTKELVRLLQSNDCQKIEQQENHQTREWLLNGQVDWSLLYQVSKGRRIPLPTYPFEKASYWVSPAYKEKNQITSLVYQSYWELDPLDFSKSSSNLNWLVFTNEMEIGAKIIARLHTLKQNVIEIRAGKTFRQLNSFSFEINPVIKKDYSTLCEVLNRENKLFSSILYCWGLLDERKIHASDDTSVDNLANTDFVKLTYLAQTIFIKPVKEPFYLSIITNCLAKLLPEDEIIPEQSLVLGSSIVIPQEFPVVCSVVDIGLKRIKTTDNQLIDLLINDCIKKINSPLIAYRHGLRFTQQFKLYELPTNGENHLKKEGVYLLIGGLGKIGLELAGYLALHYKAHLVLTTRSATPYTQLLQEQQSTSDSSLINQLKKIKELSSSLQIMQADVADFKQMRNVFRYVNKTYGKLNGLFHMAAIVDQSTRVLIKDLELDQLITQWRAKVEGIKVLVRLVDEKEIDFCLLFSSVASILGGIGLSSYAASNNYLNYFVDSRVSTRNKKTKWFSMSWDAWRHSLSQGEKSSKNGLTFRQGMSVIEQYFQTTHNPNLFISIGKLKDKFHQKDANKGSSKIISIPHSPPQIRSDLHRTIQQIFSDCLGKEEIDPDISFYALGGDSLTAITLLELIEKNCSIRVTLTDFLENQSINQLVEKIKNKQSLEATSFIVNLTPQIITKQALFFMHPVGGTVFCYLDLISFIPFYSCFAIQDPQFISDQFDFKSFEEMASIYLQEIKRKQPHGPYLLGGYSFGATLAFEMAKQLLASGEQVGKIFIIDGWAAFSPELRDRNRFAFAMQRTIEELTTQMPNALDQKEQLLELLWKRMQLLLDYKPIPISIDLILFKARDILPEYQPIDHKDNHWSLLTTKSVKTYQISGNHNTILQLPGGKEMGEIITNILS